MEKNANLHRDVGGSSLCASIAGETGDIKAVGGMKGATDTCKNSEHSLSTCLVSCNSAGSAPSSANAAISTVDKLDMPDMIESLSGQENIQSSGWSETLSSDCGDQLSNGMGHGSQLATGNSEAATSKLVNNTAEGEPSCLTGTSAARNTGAQAEISSATFEQMKLTKPTHLCPDKTTNTANVKSGVSSDHTISEGLPSGSDPSIAGESRSIDSLESFSNLNSCPSSDLNSEGLEDRGLAIALQSEYGADGTKIPCPKERGGAGQSIYHIKWIKWKEENTPIITQNENGPCPLLAIMNVLLLAWKVNDRRHDLD